MRRIGRPLDGRSRSVLLYRLWIREDADPQAGQEAVGDVVRRVSVISKATSTSSTWTSGRSGIMIIGSLSVPENALQKRKNVQLSVYHKGGQQTCVRSILCLHKITLPQKGLPKPPSSQLPPHKYRHLMFNWPRRIEILIDAPYFQA